MARNALPWLARAARAYGSPVYVYFVDEMADRCALLRDTFGHRLRLSYAVKSNPNVDVMRHLKPHVDAFDVSSIAEVKWVRSAGGTAANCSFTGPAKRSFELENAVKWGVGQIVCESAEEIAELQEICARASAKIEVLIRINPDAVPKGFGVHMARKPSKFGIDEEALDDAVRAIEHSANLTLAGWHIYSGTNCLMAEAIVENFELMIERFRRYSARYRIKPRLLVFGAGFGIPYLPGENELNIADVAHGLNPMLDAFRAEERFLATEMQLELGRWIVGPCGYLVTAVVGVKKSRGKLIALCDAGFNNHLSACGMMGSVLRRNWEVFKVADDVVGETPDLYTLAGPLCTTIDQLAVDVHLPPLARGDLLAIPSSGAYGLTASPTMFISHPPPSEVIVAGGEMRRSIDQWAAFDWGSIVGARGDSR